MIRSLPGHFIIIADRNVVKWEIVCFSPKKACLFMLSFKIVLYYLLIFFLYSLCFGYLYTFISLESDLDSQEGAR